MSPSIPVYLECGTKRVFALAVDWPGWCRHGRDEHAALAALFEHGPRYASFLARTRLGFVAPPAPGRLKVVERLRGNATTDFGAPAVAPSADRDRTCGEDELARFERILTALWRAFDRTVERAHGQSLATGPRGGGRTLAAMLDHVIGADQNYLAATGWPRAAIAGTGPPLPVVRAAILEAMRACAAGALPEKGPRGGDRWTARYLVRRVAYHVTSHLWEIERRLPAKAR